MSKSQKDNINVQIEESLGHKVVWNEPSRAYDFAGWYVEHPDGWREPVTNYIGHFGSAWELVDYFLRFNAIDCLKIHFFNLDGNNYVRVALDIGSDFFVAQREFHEFPKAICEAWLEWKNKIQPNGYLLDFYKEYQYEPRDFIGFESILEAIDDEPNIRYGQHKAMYDELFAIPLVERVFYSEEDLFIFTNEEVYNDDLLSEIIDITHKYGFFGSRIIPLIICSDPYNVVPYGSIEVFNKNSIQEIV